MDDARVVPAGTGRGLAVAQIVLGLVTIARADDIADEGWLGLSRGAVRRIVRVLGARQVVQGAVTAMHDDDPATLVVGAAVDGLHAASMLPLIAVRGPYRRQAAVSAATATAAAAVGLAASER